MRKHSLKDSFRFACDGLFESMCSEANLRVHLAFGAIVMLIAQVVSLPLAERAILLLCVAGVIVAELLNTALEAAVDLCTCEYHELARKAKNVAAGAVLIAALGAAGVGLLLLIPRLPQGIALLEQAPMRSSLFWPGIALIVLAIALTLYSTYSKKQPLSLISVLVGVVCALALHVRPDWGTALLAVLSMALTVYARKNNASHTLISAGAGLCMGIGVVLGFISIL